MCLYCEQGSTQMIASLSIGMGVQANQQLAGGDQDRSAVARGGANSAAQQRWAALRLRIKKGPTSGRKRASTSFHSTLQAVRTLLFPFSVQWLLYIA